MFAYCGNNPVIRADYNGEAWGIVLAILAVVAVCAIVETSMTTSGDNLIGFQQTTSVRKTPPPNKAFYPAIVESSIEEQSIVAGNDNNVITFYNDICANDVVNGSSGVIISLFDCSLELSIAQNDIGLYVSHSIEDTTGGFGIRLDLSKARIGFETFGEIPWDNGTKRTSTYSSIDGKYVAALAVAIYSGFKIPIPVNA